MSEYNARRGANGKPLRRSRRRRALAGNPVRLVVTKRTKRAIGYVPSTKVRGLIPWESQLERDFLHTLEVDSNVLLYEVQPEMISFEYEGIPHRYYPDVRVKMRDGTTEIVEVKYAEEATAGESYFRFIKDLYARRGISFRVETEDTIRVEPRLANAKLMRDHLIERPSWSVWLRAVEAVSQTRGMTLGELHRVLGLDPACRFELLAIALHGGLELDLETGPLSDDTRILRAYPPA